MHGSESFEAFVAERDVACPGCGYNLRGMRGGVCPECGITVGFGSFGNESSSPRMFRAGQSGAMLCAIGGLTAQLVALRAAQQNGVWAGAVCAAVGLAACGVGAVWFAKRRWVAAAPRHEQGRWATAMWVMLAGLVLVALGTGGA